MEQVTNNLPEVPAVFKIAALILLIGGCSIAVITAPSKQFTLFGIGLILVIIFLIYKKQKITQKHATIFLLCIVLVGLGKCFQVF
jgi:glucose dehydrogenase